MIVLGIDPGARIGVALLDVGSRTANVVQLVTWADEDPILPLRMGGFLDNARRADLVCVERVEQVTGVRGGSAHALTAPLATGLARGNWIGGLLAGIASAKGYQVATVPAATWRAALVGSRAPSDAQVAQTIRVRCPGWPAKSNAHQRDAAGCALWAGLARARKGESS